MGKGEAGSVTSTFTKTSARGKRKPQTGLRVFEVLGRIVVVVMVLPPRNG